MSLCWHCSAEQGFYAPKCEKCGKTNPNVNLDAALQELKDLYPDQTFVEPEKNGHC